MISSRYKIVKKANGSRYTSSKAVICAETAFSLILVPKAFGTPRFLPLDLRLSYCRNTCLPASRSAKKAAQIPYQSLFCTILLKFVNDVFQIFSVAGSELAACGKYVLSLAFSYKSRQSVIRKDLLKLKN